MGKLKKLKILWKKQFEFGYRLKQINMENNNDENIYVFLRAKSVLNGQTFEYSGTYAIGENVDMECLRKTVTEDMNIEFEEYLDIYTIPTATIVHMNEISKKLYDRLRQK